MASAGATGSEEAPTKPKTPEKAVDPNEQARSQAFKDLVKDFPKGVQIQIDGLTSDAGKIMNGQFGLVDCHLFGKPISVHEPTGTEPRVQVRLSNGQMRRLKRECLTVVALTSGSSVIIFGLTSDSGKAINGKSGLITSAIPGDERVKVQMHHNAQTMSLKRANLVRLPQGSGNVRPQENKSEPAAKKRRVLTQSQRDANFTSVAEFQKMREERHEIIQDAFLTGPKEKHLALAAIRKLIEREPLVAQKCICLLDVWHNTNNKIWSQADALHGEELSKFLTHEDRDGRLHNPIENVEEQNLNFRQNSMIFFSKR